MNILIAAVCILVIIIALVSLNPSRWRKLNEVVRDLEQYLKTAPKDQQYAIRALIVFFRASRTLPGYIFWALTTRRTLAPDKVLEIADLPLPRWEKELYIDLSHVERKDFPGLSKPLRKLLVERVSQRSVQKTLDLGCGGMEVERQVIKEILQKGKAQDVVFVGVDLAPQAWDAIQETFAEFNDKVVLKQIKELRTVDSIQPTKPTIVFYCGNALDISEMHGHYFDLIFSSRFRHHLDAEQKRRLDKLSDNLATEVIEYDDYRSATSWIPPLLTAWHRPILLNGAIFSQVRQPWKHELKDDAGMVTKIFSPPGSYARIRTRVDI
jgi:hypothetical protein